MSTDRIHYLLQRLLHHTCTPEEREELALWIDTLQNDEEWRLRLGEIWNSYGPDEKVNPEKADIILRKILDENKPESRPGQHIPSRYASLPARMMRWSVAAAAVIGILIILSILFMIKKPVGTRNTLAADQAAGRADIRPGGNKAILTLANGSKVILDSINAGYVTTSGNTQVIKMKSGLLSYNRKSGIGNNEVSNQESANQGPAIEYNTLSTPRGGQYRVRLPDGSKVWLNAASSLRFPTAFTGKERQVEIKGEAYFEIVKKSGQPFIVHIASPAGEDKGTIKVLGTHFNVNAYTDESMVKTTLLEGAVKILHGSESVQLSPGEQAVMDSKNSIKVIKDINLNETIAWKNGLFDFEGNDIRDVMRQVARWYDVDIKYENITPVHFMGTISRNANISEVLKMLEMTGAVHFKVEGKTITVLK